MPLSNFEKNLHLMWRAGFGPAIEQLDQLPDISPTKLYQGLERASARKPDYVNVADHYLQGLYMGVEDVVRMQKLAEDPETRQKVQQSNRQSIRSLNIYWLYEMVNGASQLREKMSLFWHGHFACRNLNIFYQQGLLDVIRRNALGNFGELLKQVSRTAAMLNFLNNQQNRKDHPNENFAREVMELFTMGRGHYSEKDIREAARAFTGWTANLKGDFVFRRMLHDFGSKSVLGRSGNFDGDDVLGILLEEKQTANHLAGKIYRFFVNEQPDKARIEWLADRYYKSHYDTSALLRDIFTSEWFYEEKNIGSKIKSPVELVAGLQRMLPMKFQQEEVLLLAQRALGQILFYPPNVAGWPGGKTWIDSSTLMMRMRIPQMLNDTDEFNINPKTDDDQAMGKMESMDPKGKASASLKRLNKPVIVDIDWKPYVKHFDFVPREQLFGYLSEVLLQVPRKVSSDLVIKFADNSGRSEFIKTSTIQLMSTPEYQLC